MFCFCGSVMISPANVFFSFGFLDPKHFSKAMINSLASHLLFRINLQCITYFSNYGVREGDFGVEAGWRRSRRPQLSKALPCDPTRWRYHIFETHIRFQVVHQE